MRFAAMTLLCICLTAGASARELVATSAREGGIVLAGELVPFDPERGIAFTRIQLRYTAESTRAGLVRWAATSHGRRLLASLKQNRQEVFVSEDFDEQGMGRAPQPGLATLLAANDPTQRRAYELILNPAAPSVPAGFTALPNQPATAEDFMAIAWAAEMLHIDFYARGVPLPHHQRADFQQDWLRIAAELGFPALEHGEEDEAGNRSPRRRVRVIGSRRR